MKLKAYHVYFLVIGVGAIIGIIFDNYVVNGPSSAIDPYDNLSYSISITTFYGGILLVFYYIVAWYYRKKAKSKSYI